VAGTFALGSRWLTNAVNAHLSESSAAFFLKEGVGRVFRSLLGQYSMIHSHLGQSDMMISNQIMSEVDEE
jgi:hypothetical protein